MVFAGLGVAAFMALRPSASESRRTRPPVVDRNQQLAEPDKAVEVIEPDMHWGWAIVFFVVGVALLLALFCLAQRLPDWVSTPGGIVMAFVGYVLTIKGPSTWREVFSARKFRKHPPHVWLPWLVAVVGIVLMTPS